MILIITDSIPTTSFKRSGILGFDDYIFFEKDGNDVKMIILYRITYERKFLFNVKEKISLIRNQIREIKNLIANDPSIEFIPYFSLIKPFVFKEDLFLFKKSRFSSLQFNLIIVHNMLHTGLNINWIRKQFPGSTIVLKEHTDWLVFPKLVRYFALKYIKNFDKVFSNSESSRKTFQKLFLTKKSQNKLPPIEIDYPKFRINTLKVQKSKSECLQILTVADLLKIKGFDECFNVLGILEEEKIDWFWTIIGKGIYYDKIIQQASKYNFLSRILILPEVQKTGLFEYMKKSDVYLQLSYRETFGIAPIEAFSYYNRLIISQNITSINELGLANNKNVLVIKDLQDIQSEKFNILKFINDHERNDYLEEILTELNIKINTFSHYKGLKPSILQKE